MSERLRRQWTGPVGDVPDVPDASLRRIRLSFLHDAAGEAEEELTRALSPLAGSGRVLHHALVLRSLVWTKNRWPLRARVGRRRVVMHARTLKASQLRSLVDALAQVPGARNLRLRARRP